MRYAWMALYLVSAATVCVKLDGNELGAALLAGIVNMACYWQLKQASKCKTKD